MGEGGSTFYCFVPMNNAEGCVLFITFKWLSNISLSVRKWHSADLFYFMNFHLKLKHLHGMLE